MIGILGLVMIGVSIVMGYNQYPFLTFIIIASFIGFILYVVSKVTSPETQIEFIRFSQRLYQEGAGKCIIWLLLMFAAQAVTWAIFYGIGRLFV